MMLSVYLAAQSHSPRGMPGGADAIAVPYRLQPMWVGWPTEGVGGKKLTPSPSAPSLCVAVLVPLSPALRVVSLLLLCVYAAGWLARTYVSPPTLSGSLYEALQRPKRFPPTVPRHSVKKYDSLYGESVALSLRRCKNV